MSEIIGYITQGSVICKDCALKETDSYMEPATEEGYPDGFTCDDCGEVVGDPRCESCDQPFDGGEDECEDCRNAYSPSIYDGMAGRA